MKRIFSFFFMMAIVAIFSADCALKCKVGSDSQIKPVYEQFYGKLYKSTKNAQQLDATAPTASYKYFYFTKDYLYYLAPGMVNAALSAIPAPAYHPHNAKSILPFWASNEKSNLFNTSSVPPSLLGVTTSLYPHKTFAFSSSSANEFQFIVYGNEDGTSFKTTEISDKITIKIVDGKLFLTEQYYDIGKKSFEDSWWNNVELKQIDKFDNNNP